MREGFCFLALSALFIGCTLQKEEDFRPVAYDVYYATLESPNTRTVADEDGSVLWMKNDLITIFENSTVGHAFKFTGRNGSHSGPFSPVSGEGYGAGEDIEGFYSVYPHSEENTLEADGTLILTFPNEQYYEEDSFGQGANLAVAVSDDNHFRFKNVGGYLTFKLYGADVTVSSITLRGNNGEKMAGDMSVSITEDTNPESSFLSGKWNTTYPEITLRCDPAVTLGTTSDTSTEFWFVVPAISFERGLTFTVTDSEGNSFTKSSSKPRTIERSGKTGFNPIEVVFSVAVISISLGAETATLQVGENITLTATVLPENATDKSVTWTSSDETVATVDANGKVTALKAGAATITAAAGEKAAECAVTVVPVAVTGVSLNKEELALEPGETSTLTATVLPENAANKSVIWTSDNTSVATVDGTGTVTAKSVGTATITVTTVDGNKTATCAVTVNSISITSISLNNTTLSLTKGGTATLVATITPSNATYQTVTWTSSDTSVATVDSNGKVTAVGGGSATITATAGGKTATCAVTVTVPVTGVSLNKTTLSLAKGATETLAATVTPSDATDKSVTWSSSDETVATVDEEGKVTALKVGMATITAKAGEKTAECVVTVSPVSVTSVTLNKTSLSFSTLNSTQTLTATVKPDNATDKTVTWSSNDTSVATVSSSGVVTSKGSGTATITATAGEKSATCRVTVTLAVLPTSISLDVTSLLLAVNESKTITATILPANATNKTVTWTVSDSFASVSSEGVVKGVLANGNVTVTARTSNGLTATCTVKTVKTKSYPIYYEATGECDFIIAKNSSSTPIIATFGNVYDSETQTGVIYCDEQPYYIDTYQSVSATPETRSKLTGITIPSAAVISAYAFYNCRNLATVTLPSNVKIYNCAFMSCTSLTSIDIPAGATIGESAFAGCTSLSSVSLPSALTTLSAGVFGACTSLSSISLPSGLTTIEDRALARTALTSLTIPESVTSIGAGVFEECSNLVSFTRNAICPDGRALVIDNKLCSVACSGISSYTVPSGVTTLGDRCFNMMIPSITLPASVTNMSSCSFYPWDSLTLTINATTPPDISSSSEYFDPDLSTEELQIIVPRNSVNTYKNDTNWKKWAKFIKAE